MGLANLLVLIRDWGWLSEEESLSRQDLNECLDKLRMIRNSVHPGACLRVPHTTSISAEEFDALHKAVAELLDYFDECILDDMEGLAAEGRALGKTAVSMFGQDLWTKEDEKKQLKMEQTVREMRAAREREKRIETRPSNKDAP